MEKANYVFIVYDDMSVPHFAKGKNELIHEISQCRNPRVITYNSEDDAQKVVRSYQKKQTGQSNEPQINLLGTPKRPKPANDDDSSRSAASFLNNSAEKSLGSVDTNTDKARNSNTEASMFSKNDAIYGKFKENEKAFSSAKASLNPSDNFVMFFDGGSRGNPGNAGSGYVIYTAKSQKVYSNYANIGIGTNNKAEYSGMIFGMKSALDLGIKNLEIRGDSDLVIKQMKGEYRVKNEGLKPLYQEACRLAKMFNKISYTWVPRSENSEADALSNKAMDSR